MQQCNLLIVTIVLLDLYTVWCDPVWPKPAYISVGSDKWTLSPSFRFVASSSLDPSLFPQKYVSGIFDRFYDVIKSYASPKDVKLMEVCEYKIVPSKHEEFYDLIVDSSGSCQLSISSYRGLVRGLETFRQFLIIDDETNSIVNAYIPLQVD